MRRAAIGLPRVRRPAHGSSCAGLTRAFIFFARRVYAPPLRLALSCALLRAANRVKPLAVAKPAMTADGSVSRMPASLPQKVEHPGLRQDRFGDAVALRAGALRGGLGRLQVGAEVTGALDDAASDRQPLRLEASQRWLDLVHIQR